ncbi:hypothetical protein LIA77_04265 [Sarocladium implicatum]|nr:hypothetical protein LIA77_04265 [Sarocladium implicatum]
MENSQNLNGWKTEPIILVQSYAQTISRVNNSVLCSFDRSDFGILVDVRCARSRMIGSCRLLLCAQGNEFNY